jgi:predicted RNase H-like nuclease (RuvC/YqgF family)
MDTLDVVLTSALILPAVIVMMLAIQASSLRDIRKMLQEARRKTRLLSIDEWENKELRSALRAEKAHVAQLQRKLALLQLSMPAV